MKKIILLFLLTLPMCLMAQDTLIIKPGTVVSGTIVNCGWKTVSIKRDSDTLVAMYEFQNVMDMRLHSGTLVANDAYRNWLSEVKPKPFNSRIYQAGHHLRTAGELYYIGLGITLFGGGISAAGFAYKQPVPGYIGLAIGTAGFIINISSFGKLITAGQRLQNEGPEK